MSSTTIARRSKAAGFDRLREPLTGREVFRARAACGVEVWVAPMPGYRRCYAMMTTRYGSMDTHLPDGTRLPDGIAHFLEHKMFQTPEGDVFDLYAKRGASANAFTTFTHTSYLFSSTSRFEENLDTLLETMDDITTDEVGIAREKGIIGQELAMYDDDPGWRGYFNLLQALYRRHPVRIDIGGTSETIAPIDADILERAHAAYYNPRNMVLTAAGAVDPAAVLAQVDATLGTRGRGRRHRRRATAEPRGVARRELSESLSISRPHALLGLKDRPGRGVRGRIRRRIQGSMLMEILFGDGGRIQAPLYRSGLVDDTLSAGYEAETDYAFALVSAEVDQVDPYRRALLKALRAAAKDGLTDEEVERCRRRFLGRHLRVFNGPEPCAHWMLALALEGAEPGALVESLRGATRAALQRHLRELVAAPCAWSIVTPRE
ncbi:MAG: pitrilysin family protein [Planctomycetota bacterium]|nr:pitrilysin family protein [Planctomycetota bacterium]